MLLKSLILSIMVAAVAARSPATQSTPAAQARVETLRTVHGELARSIDALVESHPEFSGALLVQAGDAVVLDAGYGFADRKRRLPFDTRTVAQIGSLTKQFTAALILGLRTQGLIDESKTLKTYLPGTAEPAASATIAELLTHTSGLAENCTDSDFTVVTLDRLKTFLRGKTFGKRPGTVSLLESWFQLSRCGWWPQTNRVLYYVSNYGSSRSVVVLKKVLELMSA